MKLLLILSLVALALGQEGVFVAQKVTDGNQEVQQGVSAVAQEGGETLQDDKKLAKRSYGWSPWYYSGGGSGYGHGWPWYGGWYGGWYPGWPWYGGYGGYGGRYHGWYKGW